MPVLNNYLLIRDEDRRRFEELYAGYRLLHTAPRDCRPMIVVNTPVPGLPVWEERLADPVVMLQAELDGLRPHLEIGDDRVPTVRVQFGTPQVALAFGCEAFVPENNLPAARTHVLKRAEDVYDLAVLANNYGYTTGGAGQPIPEPAAILIVTTAGLPMLWKRRGSA